MSIGIIGAGSIGLAVAKILANAGIPASIANSRGAESLQAVVQVFGGKITAASIQEVAEADIIFLAVNWSKIPAAVANLQLRGKIVIDANNPIEAPTFTPFDLGNKTSSEIVGSLVNGAVLVKAFNHLPAALLASAPDANGGKRVLFVAGDNVQAKAQVTELIERLGFAALDLGSLAQGGRLTQFPGGYLTLHHLVKF